MGLHESTSPGEAEFWRIWLGQAISSFGTLLTNFCLAVGIFKTTGDFTMMAGLTFANLAPTVWLGMFAGPIVDAIGPRLVILVANLCGILTTGSLLGIVLGGGLSSLTALLLVCLGSCAASFRDTALRTLAPAFVLSERLMVVNGRLSMLQAAPRLLGPPTAAILLSFISMPGILSFDAISFGVALFCAAMTTFPTHNKAKSMPFRQKISEGSNWIRNDATLWRLTRYFAANNFFNGITAGLLSGFVLYKTGGNQTALASIGVMIPIGMFLGGWLSGKIQANRSLYFLVQINALIASAFQLLIGLFDSLIVWNVSELGRTTSSVLLSSVNETIWQQKVPAQARGTVMGTRQVMTGALYPFGVLIGGFSGEYAIQLSSFGISAVFVVSSLFEIACISLLRRDERTIPNTVAENELHS